MKEVKANDYSIFIGKESLQKYDFNSYNQLAILVDENTKRDCLPVFLKANNIDAILIEIPAGEEHKNLEKCGFHQVNTIFHKSLSRLYFFYLILKCQDNQFQT